MPVSSCKLSLLFIFHSRQCSICSSELVFACVPPDVNALTNFHKGGEALYIFRGVYIILAGFQWNVTPEGCALLSCRREPVVSQSWRSILLNGQLLHLSFRPINLEPRPCATHSTLSGARPWPTMASPTRIWSAKHSGTLTLMSYVCQDEEEGGK